MKKFSLFVFLYILITPVFIVCAQPVPYPQRVAAAPASTVAPGEAEDLGPDEDAVVNDEGYGKDDSEYNNSEIPPESDAVMDEGVDDEDNVPMDGQPPAADEGNTVDQDN